MCITIGENKFIGEIIGTTIVFSNTNAESLLGVTALESASIEVDPRNQKLKNCPLYDSSADGRD